MCVCVVVCVGGGGSCMPATVHWCVRTSRVSRERAGRWADVSGYATEQGQGLTAGVQGT